MSYYLVSLIHEPIGVFCSRTEAGVLEFLNSQPDQWVFLVSLVMCDGPSA